MCFQGILGLLKWVWVKRSLVNVCISSDIKGYQSGYGWDLRIKDAHPNF